MATLRAEYDTLEPRVQTLAARGLSFGIHVVVTANRWLEIRAGLKDLIQTRLELRLGDPSDSEIDRKQAANVPSGAPGRGLSSGKLHMLAAVPRIDGTRDAAHLVDGIDDMIARVSAAWTGPAGPKLRLLPELITLDEVRTAASGDPQLDGRILLGVDEGALAPFGIDPRQEPHLYLYGDAGMGKSSFLRGIVREITRLYQPNEAKIFVVDYRRSLLGDIPEEYLGAYLTSHELASGGMNDLAGFFAGRIPGPDVTPAQLRDRSWWKGRRASSSSTTTTSSRRSGQPAPAAAASVGAGRRSRPARDPHAPDGRRQPRRLRPDHPAIHRPGRDRHPARRQPGGGALIGRLKPVPSVPGRAQIVSRERGLVTAQLASVPPEHD
jgi:S-DNA-T family DNA segregation ATPase FtsK/SpoIIIE